MINEILIFFFLYSSYLFIIMGCKVTVFFLPILEGPKTKKVKKHWSNQL